MLDNLVEKCPDIIEINGKIYNLSWGYSTTSYNGLIGSYLTAVIYINAEKYYDSSAKMYIFRNNIQGTGNTVEESILDLVNNLPKNLS